MRDKDEDELNSDEHELDDNNAAEVDADLSPVASTPKKNIATLIILMLSAVILVYFLFFRNNAPPAPEEKPNISKTIPITKPTPDESNLNIPTLPSLPTPPPLVVPTPPAPVVAELPKPPTSPPPTTTATPTLITEAIPPIPIVPTKVDAQMEQRKKSSIMLGGGGASAEDQKKANSIVSIKDSFFSPTRTPADQQKATSLGEPSLVIAQGKIIDAVLETAINTDLIGTIRAIVSRDVYGEAGKNILIPKGSRLIGSYTASVSPGQTRVAVRWYRLIRPDGIDFIIDRSWAVDALGRTGIEGIVDNKYFEILGNALLISSINIGTAVAAQKITNAQAITQISTTPVSGGTTVQQSGTAKDYAVQNAVSNLNSVGQQLTQQNLKTTPTIYIDQGSLIKVFVNQDLIFPANLATNIRYIE